MPIFSPLTMSPLPSLPLAALSGPSPKGKRSKKRFRSGASRIKHEKFTIVDKSRETQAHKKYKGNPHRELKGEIWRPAAKTVNRPLVVYCHGFLSNRREALYLVKFLASHGYTIISADFPLTCMKSPQGPFVQDIINQPGDVSFLIDYMLERNADPQDDLYSSINPEDIALMGVSLGGLTSMLTTFHQELCDPRVSALVSIAAPTTIFTEKFFSGNNVPTLLIYGDADSLVLYDEHAFNALAKIKGSTLVTLRSGSHAGFSNIAKFLWHFLKHPDRIAFWTLPRWKDEEPWDFVQVLGGEEVGIAKPEREKPPQGVIIPLAMKADRQHMFTILVTHAFLEKQFAEDPEVRESAEEFLHHVLPEENLGEVSVIQRQTCLNA